MIYGDYMFFRKLLVRAINFPRYSHNIKPNRFTNIANDKLKNIGTPYKQHMNNIQNQLSGHFTPSLEPGLYYLNPSYIFYTQPLICLHFKNGKNLNELIASLENKTITPESIPTIQIIEYNGKYFSFDNRRYVHLNLRV